MIQVAALYIYPIKSLGGISLQSSHVTKRGLAHDRNWMLVDENNIFLSQRTIPKMALLRTSIEGKDIIVWHKKEPGKSIRLPLTPAVGPTDMVTIWDDQCEGQSADPSVNQWFAQQLGIKCRAVFMPAAFDRKVDPRYAVSKNDTTGFADAYPVLLISDASLDDLNNRLESPVPMDRFRPNVVVSGCRPFAEDEMRAFMINGVGYNGVKLCSRCLLTVTDQETGIRGKEPLKTLASYRTINNKVCFGQNVICKSEGQINVGDIVV